jgi:hypothetical protein
MTKVTSTKSIHWALTPPILLLLAAQTAQASNPISRNETELSVDLIELNHHYDKCGKKSYDQVIFYEWSAQYRRFHVIAWCLIEEDDPRLPVRMPGSDHYVVRWPQRECGSTRKVTSPLFRETWSKVDPERENKKLLDEKYRLSLNSIAPKNSSLGSGGQLALR